MQASAPTSIDHDARTVFISPRKVEALNFGGASPAVGERLKKVMLDALPDEQPMTISLDRVLALVQAGETEKAREAAGITTADARPVDSTGDFGLDAMARVS